MANEFLALAQEASCVAEADRAAYLERFRREADAIAEYLTETLLPPEFRVAGIRIEWEDAAR